MFVEKNAKRKVKCKVCGREISKGEKYYVEESTEIVKEWIGFDKRWHVAAWRYPTKSIHAKRRRIVCPECKERLIEGGRKREEEIERAWRERVEKIKNFVINELKKVEIANIDEMKHSFEEGMHTSSNITTYFFEALGELKREGKIEFVLDPKLGMCIKLRIVS
jgi:DNA repair exonuclease SbcCD ATPase subunit